VKFTKAEIRKWVKALESGKYKQGKGQLVQTVFEEKEYCCLGVLCDVLGVDQKRMREEQPMPGRITGLKLQGSGFSPVELADMNDEAGMSFKEIAQEIKKRALK